MPDRYRVSWAPVAIEDTIAIVEYLAQESPEQAARLFERFRARCASLERLPERGRVVPELQALGIRFLRELVIGPYRVLYRIERNSVHVVAAFDGRRNLDDIILERALRDIER